MKNLRDMNGKNLNLPAGFSSSMHVTHFTYEWEDVFIFFGRYFLIFCFGGRGIWNKFPKWSYGTLHMMLEMWTSDYTFQCHENPAVHHLSCFIREIDVNVFIISLGAITASYWKNNVYYDNFQIGKSIGPTCISNKAYCISHYLAWIRA